MNRDNKKGLVFRALDNMQRNEDNEISTDKNVVRQAWGVEGVPCQVLTTDQKGTGRVLQASVA